MAGIHCPAGCTAVRLLGSVRKLAQGSLPHLPTRPSSRPAAAPQHPGIDLRFFLAQPPTAEALATWLPAIQVSGLPDRSAGPLCPTARLRQCQ